MKNTISVLALAALFPLADTAMAADKFVGGDCCADLEERIAELEATTAKKGNRKVSLTVYGQVNAGLLWFDPDIEGVDTDGPAVIDNQVSQSRFGFKGEAKINPGWSAGFKVEIGLDQTVDEEPVWNANDIELQAADGYGLKIRQAYWFIKAENFGTVSVGQVSMATDEFDSISTVNLGGAIKYLSVEPVGSAYLFGFGLPFDGVRDQAVRFDTANVGGFFASAAWADQDNWDAALRYAGEFGQIRVAGAVGYRAFDAVDLGILSIDASLIPGLDIDGKTISASGAISHVPSGLFLNGMYAHYDVDAKFAGDKGGLVANAWHIVGGIAPKIFAVGTSTFYGEYAQIDIDTNGELDGIAFKPQWYGAGFVQAIDAAAMDLYINARQYDLDTGIEGIGDPIVVMGGARIKF